VAAAPVGGETVPLPRGAFAIYLVRGALALGFGTAVLVFGSGFSRLCTFAALYAIGAGLVGLHWLRAQHRTSGRHLGPGLALGLLWLGAGVAVLLREPLQGLVGEDVLLDLLGLATIATGVVRLTGRFHDDQLSPRSPRPRYRLVVGPLDILLGLAILAADDHTATGIRITLGVWGVTTATFLLADALAVRRGYSK
jgi:uncharacterized membrane protein HdeD (DUF308 family)